jgi:hypothetical protein
MKKKDGQINKMTSEFEKFYSSLDSLLLTENSNADCQGGANLTSTITYSTR